MCGGRLARLDGERYAVHASHWPAAASSSPSTYSASATPPACAAPGCDRPARRGRRYCRAHRQGPYSATSVAPIPDMHALPSVGTRHCEKNRSQAASAPPPEPPPSPIPPLPPMQYRRRGRLGRLAERLRAAVSGNA